MASISKLTVGQTLYDVRAVRMGNTTMSRRACYDVVVKAIAPDFSSIEALWNGNPPGRYYPREVAKLRVNKPKPKGERFGMSTY